MADTPQQIAERLESLSEDGSLDDWDGADPSQLLKDAAAMLRACQSGDVLEANHTCGNCQHWKNDLRHKPDLGWCTNSDSMASAGHFGSSKNYTEADDGCVLHWSAKP